MTRQHQLHEKSLLVILVNSLHVVYNNNRVQSSLLNKVIHVTYRIWLALEDLVTAEAARRESESDCQELVSLSQNPVCDEIYY